MKIETLIVAVCLSPVVVLFVDFLDMTILYQVGLQQYVVLLKKALVDLNDGRFYLHFLYQTGFIAFSYFSILTTIYAKGKKV